MITIKSENAGDICVGRVLLLSRAMHVGWCCRVLKSETLNC